MLFCVILLVSITCVVPVYCTVSVPCAPVDLIVPECSVTVASLWNVLVYIVYVFDICSIIYTL